MKKPPKFVILPGNGPNKKSRVAFVGGNGETIFFGEGYVGGIAAARRAIEHIKQQVGRAPVLIRKPVVAKKTAPGLQKRGPKK